MDSVVRVVIEAIHSSPTRVVLCLSGGAAQALGWLLSVPRASRTMLEATIPYSRASMVQLLGKVPTQFVCRETADEIAMAAYNRALKLSMPGVQVAGIGFTGALASVTYHPSVETTGALCQLGHKLDYGRLSGSVWRRLFDKMCGDQGKLDICIWWPYKRTIQVFP